MISIHSLASNLLPSLRTSKTQKVCAIRAPGYLKNPFIVVPSLPNNVTKKRVLEELNKLSTIPLVDGYSSPRTSIPKEQKDSITLKKMYTILESISDRIEMHQNIKEQRENWNSLLLNSVNMITLTATTMAALGGVETSDLALKISSVVLFLAVTGLLLIMNKVQPSQLVEEQRNSVRLFKQLKTEMETKLLLQTATKRDVENAMERVLALDRAYPLPLLGAMLDKFPATFKPATWWPKSSRKLSPQEEMPIHRDNKMHNGWSKDLEDEMREIVEVMKRKDIEDYVRLGNKALKLSKMLAVAGPVLTAIAATGTGLSLGQDGSWTGLVAVMAGSIACVVNTVQHGGQVGMVFEMYRNCAGFFNLLTERIESNLEQDLQERENGELFELKLAMQLGRSLSELRDLSDRSTRSGGTVDEFASKLF